MMTVTHIVHVTLSTESVDNYDALSLSNTLAYDIYSD